MPLLVEFLPLRRVHPRHQEEIVSGFDLFLAVVAPAAGNNTGCAPAYGVWLVPVAGRQGQEPFPPFAEDREDVRQFVAAADIVEPASGCLHCGPEDQGDSGVGVDSGVKQLVSVSGKLEQRRHFGMAGQFGVVHGVAAVVLFDEEVGTAVEAAVKEGRLEDDVRSRPQRVY